MMNRSLELSLGALLIVALELNKMACPVSVCIPWLVFARKKKESEASKKMLNEIKNTCLRKEEVDILKTISMKKATNKLMMQKIPQVSADFEFTKLSHQDLKISCSLASVLSM